MEGSESEAIFDSLNLNPQLFINSALNIVDELIDEAFDYLHKLVYLILIFIVKINIHCTCLWCVIYREASTQLKIDGSDRAEDLTKVY